METGNAGRLERVGINIPKVVEAEKGSKKLSQRILRRTESKPFSLLPIFSLCLVYSHAGPLFGLAAFCASERQGLSDSLLVQCVSQVRRS